MLNIHAVMERSQANGPGLRAVIWVQGCQRHCPGCCNPETHDPDKGKKWSTKNLLSWLSKIREDGIEGITVSGGEPLDQERGLMQLLDALPRYYSVVLYSGYTKDEISKKAYGPGILGRTDILVCGPYDKAARTCRGMRGSSNQRVLLLSDRYRPEDVRRVPETEVHVMPDGTVIQTGVGVAPMVHAGGK